MARKAKREFRLSDLTEGQRLVLASVANSPIAGEFYLTGGTALRAAYLHHRTSIDLDFFSRERVRIDDVRSVLNGAGFSILDSSRVHDRWDMTLGVGSERVKAEFVHYAFDRVAAAEVSVGALEVDSLRDILANKLSAVVDRFEAKDYADILLILRTGMSLRKGIADSSAKFGWSSLEVLLQQAFVRAGRLTMWPELSPRVLLAEAQTEFRRLAETLIELPEDEPH